MARWGSAEKALGGRAQRSAAMLAFVLACPFPRPPRCCCLLCSPLCLRPLFLFCCPPFPSVSQAGVCWLAPTSRISARLHNSISLDVCVALWNLPFGSKCEFVV
jgi:hypothetical protein